MNILDLAQPYGTYRKASTAKGGEFVGPCPVRGTCNGAGEDRFHIWPEQAEHGTWWCRKCDKGGDAIQFLIDVEGKSYPEACRALGKEIADQHDYRTPQPKQKPGSSWQPTAPAAPAELWLQHAAKFADWAHQQLLALGEEPGTPLHYLASRGIRRETAIKFRLGWNSGEKGKDLYRAREAWGLETVMKGDKKKKLWLPIGLTIPFYSGEILRRVRIRIPKERRTAEFNTPYYIVPGSAMDTFVSCASARAWFITEAELDAILIDQEAGDLTGVMAMGNSSAKPTAEAFELLSQSLHIANALDYDLREGSTDNPGGVSWLWWKEHFTQADRWPVPVGKDPGDAWEKGTDLREWVKLALPPVLTLPVKTATAPQPAASAETEQQPEKTADQFDPSADVLLVVSRHDGREIRITDNALAYDRLASAGKVVFTGREVMSLKQAGLTPEQTAIFIDLKTTFPGVKITDINAIINKEQQ